LYREQLNIFGKDYETLCCFGCAGVSEYSEEVPYSECCIVCDHLRDGGYQVLSQGLLAALAALAIKPNGGIQVTRSVHRSEFSFSNVDVLDF